LITATLINYFFHCKTQCWLYGRRVGFINDFVLEGNAKHLVSQKISEVNFYDFSVDYIDDEYVIEVKKSKADLEAGRWQLIYYLWKLKQKGIIRKGKLEVFDDNYYEIIELNEEIEKKLINLIHEIETLLNSPMPEPQYEEKCQRCSYFEFCFI
jgi:CRISPR-associated exonuclease Cas4